MTDIFSRPRTTTARIVANVAAGVILAVILIWLVFIIVDERCSRAVSAADPGKIPVQQVPFAKEK